MTPLIALAGAPLSLVGGAFAVGAAALVALYVLKLRRRRVEVPFAQLWRRVLRDTESVALWRRLRRLLSLAVQLTVLALLLLSIGDPRLAASDRGRTVVLLVDTSASMQSLDGPDGRSRLEEAKEHARRLIRGLGGDDAAMLVALDGQPAPVTGFTSDDRELLRAVDGLAATDAPADLDRALRLSADALRGRPRATLILVGDGAYDDSVLRRIAAGGLSGIDLGGADLRFQPVGRSGDNVGITAFAVRRYRANATAYEVLVEVQSFRSRRSTVRLELVQDGEVVEAQRLQLDAGERVQRLYPNLAGEGTQLEARLAPDEAAGPQRDVLPLDDRAYALLPPRKKLKVLLVSGGNLFLEGALLLDENLEVQKVAPAAYDGAATARFDAVVLDGFTPPSADAPRTHALYLDPQGAGSPFTARGTVAAPFVTETAADHPLLRWVTLKDLNIARASTFALTPGDVAVVSSLRQPIIAARERGGRKTVAFGFDLRQSDLPLRVAFPVLVVNALDWFAGSDTGLLASFATGRAWRLPAPAGVREMEVRGPDGARTHAPVHDGRATFYGARAGYYELAAPGVPPRRIAANLASAAESRVQPRREIVIGGAGKPIATPDPPRIGVRRAVWSYLVLAALLLVLVEWWTYNRRITV